MNLAAEHRRFIDSAVTVRVATLSASGIPMVTPLWFGRDGDTIYLGTRASAPHTRNMIANPNVTLLIGDRWGRRTKRVLCLAGTAEVRGFEAMTWRRKASLAWRYFLRPGAAADYIRNWRKLRTRHRYYGERTDGVCIEIHLSTANFIEQPLASRRP